MRFIANIWTTVTTVTHWLILSPLEDYGLWQSSQQPIGGLSQLPTEIEVAPPKLPLLTPPGSNLPGFECDYGPDWYDCTQEYTGCWIRNRVTNKTYDISDDYETEAPNGTTRNYVLYVTDQETKNVDGINFTEAKLFNGTFPGPLLEACWGDTVNITVVNNMTWNGTSIHWHGIRQLNTTHMDGVNGITQCPIAPGQNFTYTWNATQYGSSWYHSHYSVQYADGLQGPITIHGPTSVDYDEAVIPLLTSDWLHNSAFSVIAGGDPKNATILLNGTGNCQRFFGGGPPLPICGTPPKGFEYPFNSTSPSGNGTTKYLFRIINTSFSTAITFSIDNHTLTVVEADFVPTEPSKPLTSISVSIGQRYHVIVEALADPYADGSLGNFWIRTGNSSCGDDISGTGPNWNATGIIRYNASSNADPPNQPWPNSAGQCIDDLSMQLQPVYKWNVTHPKNGNGGETFNINFNIPVQYAPYQLAFVAFEPQQGPMNGSINPFQTTWGNPTFLNLDNDEDSWPVGWMVIPENYTDTDFVYLVLQGGGHPIHLHGHDFAVVEYAPNSTYDPNVGFNASYTDLMRRDVILTPPDGYTVIAFKTDNPGPWLMHCHIAFHASGGLSLQIMERQSAANAIWPPNDSNALRAARKTCMGWNNWAYNCTNYWPGEQPLGSGNYPACGNGTNIQNDSGV